MAAASSWPGCRRNRERAISLAVGMFSEPVERVDPTDGCSSGAGAAFAACLVAGRG